ncbi:hypothetical protein HDU82_001441 [Entophlyctis luteolus]|nr:hypothetical protein HDU82_001441 [Entophlyctis luteolus]
MFLFGSGLKADGLLDKALRNIGSKTIILGTNKMEFWISSLTVSKPLLHNSRGASGTIYPSECRERGISYKGKLQGKLNWRVNGGPVISEAKLFGDLPVMVRSSRCNIENASPRDLVTLK